jgi:hypothetical protein
VWQASKTLSADMTRLRPWQAAILGVLEQSWTLTAEVIILFIYSSVQSDLAETRLDGIKGRLVHIGPIATAVLSALVGGALIAVGIFGLVTD